MSPRRDYCRNGNISLSVIPEQKFASHRWINLQPVCVLTVHVQHKFNSNDNTCLNGSFSWTIANNDYNLPLRQLTVNWQPTMLKFHKESDFHLPQSQNCLLGSNILLDEGVFCRFSICSVRIVFIFDEPYMLHGDNFSHRCWDDLGSYIQDMFTFLVNMSTCRTWPG